MPLALYFVRHERRHPLDRTFHSPLLLEGQRGARLLAASLSKIQPRVHVLYSSPFRRCLETWGPFLEQSQTVPPLQVRIENALYERIAAETAADRARGETAFHPARFRETVSRELPHAQFLDTQYESWLPLEAVLWNESVADVQERARAFLEHVRRTHVPTHSTDVINVVIVTHLSVLNAMLDRPDDAEFPMGCVHRVEYEPLATFPGRHRRVAE